MPHLRSQAVGDGGPILGRQRREDGHVVQDGLVLHALLHRRRHHDGAERAPVQRPQHARGRRLPQSQTCGLSHGPEAERAPKFPRRSRVWGFRCSSGTMRCVAMKRTAATHRQPCPTVCRPPHERLSVHALVRHLNPRHFRSYHCPTLTWTLVPCPAPSGSRCNTPAQWRPSGSCT